VVGNRIGALVGKMRYISNHLNKDRHEEIVRNCDTGSCLLEVDSTDLLGESAKAYNTLINSLFSSIKSELMVREFTSMLTLRLELEDLSQTTLPTLFASTSTEAGAIIMKKEGELYIVASHRIADPLQLAKSDVISSALKTGARKVLDIPEGVVMQGALVDFAPRSVWVEPLMYHSVALGVIVLASSADALVKRADESLYKAKEEGRNRIIAL
jgi:hypothetical protein